MTSITAILAFWGKAQPRDPSAEVRWHPVAYHLLDVAAVVEALLNVRPSALETTGRTLGLAPDDARRLVVTLAALHDLGKFSPAFQAKVPEIWPSDVLGPYLDRWAIPGRQHTEDGLVLWEAKVQPRTIERLWPEGASALRTLSPAIFGHHGRPVGGAIRDATLSLRFPRSEAIDAAVTCAEIVLELLVTAPIAARAPDTRAARCASWWVSGGLGGLTLGSSAVLAGVPRDLGIHWWEAGFTTFAQHELGHTFQFIFLSQLGRDPWGKYLGLGVLGFAGQFGIGPGCVWENLASKMGGGGYEGCP